MSVELRPRGVTCNIACRYCYQAPQRQAGNLPKGYDMAAMKAAILAEGGPFTLFGGEPLLMDRTNLEDLWSWGLETFGENHLQTNGVLIDDDHIRMFRQYQVRVGISIDGPEELNDARWKRNLTTTRRATATVESVIRRLCTEGLAPSLIVTLHRINATADKLPRMRQWIKEMEGMGVDFVRLHLLEVENAEVRSGYALSAEENIQAVLSFAALEEELQTLKLDVFADMEQLLLIRDRGVTCVWSGCDPYTTSAVRGVEGQGQRRNCGRTNKEGIDFVKSETPGYERYLALYHTPWEYGGCQGCRFFLACKGQCPGTAIDGDWRNRTEHCAVWMALFERIEQRLLAGGRTPLSLHPRRADLERGMLAAWAAGTNPKLEQLLDEVHAGEQDEPPGLSVA
jgi:uncharacterized protein